MQHQQHGDHQGDCILTDGFNQCPQWVCKQQQHHRHANWLGDRRSIRGPPPFPCRPQANQAVSPARLLATVARKQNQDDACQLEVHAAPTKQTTASAGSTEDSILH